MDGDVHSSDVRPVAWGAEGLLVMSGVLVTLIWVDSYPQGRALTLSPPIYLGPSTGEVAVWAAFGLLALGPLVVWAGVAWYSRTPVVDGIALAAAVLSVSAYVHQCVYVNGQRWYYPPAWVGAATLGVWATGWAFGLPLLIAARRQRWHGSVGLEDSSHPTPDRHNPLP